MRPKLDVIQQRLDPTFREKEVAREHKVSILNWYLFITHMIVTKLVVRKSDLLFREPA